MEKEFKGISKAEPYEPTDEEKAPYENLEKEFNLSEKRQIGNYNGICYFHEEHVKEFINRLKEEIISDGKNLNNNTYSLTPKEIRTAQHELSRALTRIDKLAGEELKGGN